MPPSKAISNSSYSSLDQNSPAEDFKPLPVPKKRKLVSQACDLCRKSKTKCVRSNGGACTQCKQSSSECTYEIQPKKRGPRKGRVEELETALGSLQTALARLLHQDETAEHVLMNYLTFKELATIKAIDLSSSDEELPALPKAKGFLNHELGFMNSNSEEPIPALEHALDHSLSHSPEFCLMGENISPDPNSMSSALGMNFGDMVGETNLEMQTALDSSNYLQWGLERDLAFHELMTSYAIGSISL